MPADIMTLASITAVCVFAFFIWDRYRPFRHRLGIEASQTMFAKFNSPGGRLGLVFYVMSITNNSSTAFTVKEVLLRCTVNDENFESESQFIQTGIVTPNETNEPVPSALVQVGRDNVILMRWRNLREVIGEHKVVAPGGVLVGSAYFPLPINELAEIPTVKALQIVVTDYKSGSSTYDIDISAGWTETHPNAVLLSKVFKADGKGNVSFT